MARDDTPVHPITSHLQSATEHLRSANHATYTDYREVTDLYDTLGALTALLDRLPQLLAHLSRRIVRVDAAVYTTDHDSPAEDTLNIAELAITDATRTLTSTATDIKAAWTAIGHLRIHDTGTDPA
jgi:hypothetical protein